MFSGFIGVLDSGIGGLSVLKKLVKNLPNEKFIYLGDNLNAPYGNKSKRELLSLTINNINILCSHPLKAIVLACNTLSTNLLHEIRECVCVPIFPIFPPIEICEIKMKKTLLLATCATAKNYKRTEWCDVVGLEGLAGEIEEKIFNLNSIDLALNMREKSYGDFIDEKGWYDTVILGCTHYEFIKNKILDHFCPQKVTCGADFLLKNLKHHFIASKSLVKHSQNQVMFIGDSAGLNKELFESYILIN